MQEFRDGVDTALPIIERDYLTIGQFQDGVINVSSFTSELVFMMKLIIAQPSQFKMFR